VRLREQREILARVNEVLEEWEGHGRKVADGPLPCPPPEYRGREKGGKEGRVTAKVSGKWVELSAPIARGRIHGLAISRCAWDLARVNGAMRGAAKIGIRGRSGCAEIFREIWIDSEEMEEGLAGCVREGVADVEEARRRVRGGGEIVECTEEIGNEGDNLVEVIRMAGWACNQRSEWRVAVQLEVPGIFVQAMVTGGKRISAVVEVHGDSAGGDTARLSSPKSGGTGFMSGASREAIGVVLLCVSGRVRWVRGGVREGKVVLEGSAGAAEVGHLLSALSVVAQMSMRELGALRDEETAKRFLAMRGWSSRSAESVSRPEEYADEPGANDFV
jgi:hypothetical protein